MPIYCDSFMTIDNKKIKKYIINNNNNNSYDCFPVILLRQKHTKKHYASENNTSPAIGGRARTRETRSSAIAERPRDASCLSVVSFNSTIPQAQSFI